MTSPELDPEKIKSQLLSGKIPSFLEISSLLDLSYQLFISEPNMLPVSSPCVLIGDLHGQFFDFLGLLLNLADASRPTGSSERFMEAADYVARSTKETFVFLGDVVDRGYYSLETILLILCFKCLNPERVFLIRGNHESSQITRVYGFYEELRCKFPRNAEGTILWRSFCEVFNCIPLCALVDKTVFCVHGGLSRDEPMLSEIQDFDRVQEVPLEGVMCDLLWSDPSDTTPLSPRKIGAEVEEWGYNSRGAGISFGKDLVARFLHKNALSKIYRSHQLVKEGFRKHFDGLVTTVWSAPNYCYRCGNLASVCKIDCLQNEEFVVFREMSDERRSVPDVGAGINSVVL